MASISLVAQVHWNFTCHNEGLGWAPLPVMWRGQLRLAASFAR